MVWSEYVQETVYDTNDYAYDSNDDEPDPPSVPLTFDEWCAWHSEDLMNMWMSLVQYREDSGMGYLILNFANFTDFCEFCWGKSTSFVR
jgi:hypothetical protein